MHCSRGQHPIRLTLSVYLSFCLKAASIDIPSASLPLNRFDSLIGPLLLREKASSLRDSHDTTVIGVQIPLLLHSLRSSRALQSHWRIERALVASNIGCAECPEEECR